MNFDIRPANADEMVQFGRLGVYVYAGSFGDSDDNIMVHSNRPEWTLCAFDGATLAASFCVLPLTMRCQGGAVPLGGVSMVGTLPEYRRRGLSRRLMTDATARMRDNGQPLAALWASQAAIYQRYGYAMTSVLRSYQVDTVDIAMFDGDAGSSTVSRMPVTDAYDTLKAIYIESIGNKIGYLHRSRALWQHNQLDDVPADGPVHVAISRRADGTPDGYVIYTVRSGKINHPARSQEMHIRDLQWLTADAYRSLWSFIAGHDLVGRVNWTRAPVDDPAPEFFREPRMLGTRDGEGVWTRIVDVAPALEARGYVGDGKLTIGITADDIAPWNEGTWALTVEGGTGTVSPSTSAPDLVMPVKTLASLYMGFRSARELAAWGLLTGEPSAIARADDLFKTWHAPHCADHF